jgi:hypothetical protein
MKRLMNEHRVSGAVYKYRDSNDKLSKIKDSYNQELFRLTTAN